MASDIGTNASFTTTNMKPASGEQVDSLWGQNTADNAGYSYYREIPVPLYNKVTNTSVFLFRKQSSHNGFRFAPRASIAGAVTSYARFYLDGVDQTDNSLAALAGTKAYTMVGSTVTLSDFDISSLSNGSYYYVKYDDGGGVNALSAYQLYGSGATY